MLLKLASVKAAFYLCFCILLLNSSITVAQEAASEDAQSPILVALEKIKKLREEIQALDDAAAKAEGEGLESIGLQRRDKNKQLITELQELSVLAQSFVKDGGDLNALLGDFRDKILRTGASLRSEIEHHQQQMDDNSKDRDTQTPEGLKAYIADSNQLSSSIVLLDEYVKIVKAMDFDAGPSIAFIKEKLPRRLESLAGRIRLSIERQAELNKTLGTTPDDGDAKAKLPLVEEKLKHDTRALQESLNIASNFDLEVSQYQTLLVKTTGEISSDMLDTEVIGELVRDWWLETKHSLRNNAINVVLKIIVFILIIAFFKFLSSLIARLIRRSVQSEKVRLSVLMQNMAISLASRIVMLLGILVALAQLGVSLGPVLAGLGVAGFVIGFALQDTLGNFAAGMMILAYRPYDVGDVVEAAGAFGKVQSMNVVSTTILTFDNQTLILPNSKIWGDVIKNVTAQRERRVDMVFGIGYGDDIPKAEKILNDIVVGHEKVLKDPAPVIKLHTLGESSVDFIVRPWSKTEDYWDVYWDITREVKMRFDAEGVSIPFPQRDVHIYNT